MKLPASCHLEVTGLRTVIINRARVYQRMNKEEAYAYYSSMCAVMRTPRIHDGETIWVKTSGGPAFDPKARADKINALVFAPDQEGVPASLLGLSEAQMHKIITKLLSRRIVIKKSARVTVTVRAYRAWIDIPASTLNIVARETILDGPHMVRRQSEQVPAVPESLTSKGPDRILSDSVR